MNHAYSWMITGVLFSRAAFSVTPLDEDASPGTHALRFKKSVATWNGFKAVVFDGTITDHQAESVTYDRRLGGGGAFGFEQPLAPNLSVRADFRGESVTRRRKMSLVPETVAEDSWITMRPSADVTYITPASLELFAGGTYIFVPAHTERMESRQLASENRYGSSKLFVPRFGLTRRAGFANGGIYYSPGRESTRDVTKSVGDGNDITMIEPVFEPTTAGLFAEFTAAGLAWNLDAAAVSGSEGGLRSASGTTLSDDFMLIRLGAIWGGFIKGEIAHQTASYSKSAYMTLDNVPLTSISSGKNAVKTRRPLSMTRTARFWARALAPKRAPAISPHLTPSGPRRPATRQRR